MIQYLDCSNFWFIFLSTNRDAQAKGFQDNLYLELDTYHNPPAGTKSRLKQAILQELSAANIFLVLKTGEIVTPSLKRGTILPGECNLYVDMLDIFIYFPLSQRISSTNDQLNIF